MKIGKYAVVERVSRALLRRGWFDAKRYSAGQHVNPMPDGYDWVVVTKRGRPVVLAYDAYEAANALVDLELGVARPLPRKPVRMARDADVQSQRHRAWWEGRGRFGYPYGRLIEERARSAFLRVLAARGGP